LLSTHYRQPVRLTDQALEAARASLRRLDDFVRRLAQVQLAVPCVEEIEGWIVGAKESFRRALYDDLNISAALGALFRLVRQVNHLLAQGKLCPKHAAAVRETLEQMDRVLGVLLPADELGESAIPKEIAALAAEREQARAEKDFERADALRGRITAQGYQVEDTAEGPVVRRGS
jgi:cysteinyl-tRNA synthetase